MYTEEPEKRRLKEMEVGKRLRDKDIDTQKGKWKNNSNDRKGD